MFHTASSAMSAVARDTPTPLKHKVVQPPPPGTPDLDSLYSYTPDFYTPAEADKLLTDLTASIQYLADDQAVVKMFGKVHKAPRQIAAYGDEGTAYTYSGTTFPAQPWPDVLLRIKRRVEIATGQDFNFVLVNRYRDGKDRIGYHRDNEPGLDEDAHIASVSFGEARDFTMQAYKPDYMRATKPGKRTRVFTRVLNLTHGSLLDMYPSFNRCAKHAVPARPRSKGVRINLTFRKMVPEEDEYAAPF